MGEEFDPVEEGLLIPVGIGPDGQEYFWLNEERHKEFMKKVMEECVEIVFRMPSSGWLL